jgi:5-methylcytosine-specific restriction endonuclease McrA
VTPSATGEYDVRLTITATEHEDLRKAQELLGHAVPSGDPALVYARAMSHYLAHLEKQRLGAKPGAAASEGTTKGRAIRRRLRRLVWERDGGRCTFVSADGHRCEETGRLEVDHITPVAMGGESTPENLRLLCSAHNQHEAERVLGREHVRRRREIAHRERARAKVAAQASRERAKARDAARQARHDDVHAALRGLGSSVAEARRGAEVADAMPDDASLESCLRAALTELTRPLVMRSERMARNTA